MFDLRSMYEYAVKNGINLCIRISIKEDGIPYLIVSDKTKKKELAYIMGNVKGNHYCSIDYAKFRGLINDAMFKIKEEVDEKI